MTLDQRAARHTSAGPADRLASRRRLGRWIAGSLAIAFGLATLTAGGRVLFGAPQAGAAAGAVVPFVVAFNFAAGFAYVVGGAATVLRRGWAPWVARGLAVATLAVFVAFGAHVAAGGAYQARTALALAFRSGFWLAQALILPGLLRGGPAAKRTGPGDR